MKAKSSLCKCHAVFRERFLSTQYFNILTLSLLTQIKERHHRGQQVLLNWKEPGHCCRSQFTQKSFSPCIRLLVWKPSSSLSTVSGSKQKFFIFSSRYQLKFSSTMLNIRAKALAAPVPSIVVTSAVPKLQMKRKVIKKARDGIEFKNDNNLGALKEIHSLPKVSRAGWILPNFALLRQFDTPPTDFEQMSASRG